MGYNMAIKKNQVPDRRWMNLVNMELVKKASHQREPTV